MAVEFPGGDTLLNTILNTLGYAVRRRMIRGQDLTAVLVCGCLVVATSCARARGGEAESGRGAFEAGLVRCAEVNQPTRLANCGMDPLQDGTAEITDDGEVEVKVVRAVPNVIYDVIYRSLNGASQRRIGSLRTDGSGNGALNVDDLFTRDQIGAGNIVVMRSGADQFVTGFKIRR